MNTRQARRTSRTKVLGRIISRQDIERTVGQGMTTAQAAQTLKVSVWTVWRACRDCEVEPPARARRVQDAEEWRRLYEQHGAVRTIARAIGINRTHVKRELERYGIVQGADAWVEAGE